MFCFSKHPIQTKLQLKSADLQELAAPYIEPILARKPGFYLAIIFKTDLIFKIQLKDL